MTKVAIICNDAHHLRILGINPNNPDLVIITPESTYKMKGFKDIYYYEMRPMYAREKEHADTHDWKSINKTELKELLKADKNANNPS